MLGLFLVGFFITGIVTLACVLIVAGIRTDQLERRRDDAEHLRTPSG